MDSNNPDNPAYLEALKSMPVPEMPADLLPATMARIHEKQNLKRKHLRSFGMGMAMAASLLLVVSSMQFFNSDTMGVPQIVLAVQEQRDVNLVFNSPEQMDGAVISLHLPNNIRLAGFGDRQLISWEISLKAGKNLLTLPVIAIASGQSEITAEISRGDQAKIFKVAIDVNSGVSDSLDIQPV